MHGFVWILATAGLLVFARGGGLWQQDASGAGEAVQVTALADDASEVLFIEPTRDGSLLVLDLGAATAWVVRDGGKAEVRSGPCTARARPSPKGECVVCPGATGAVLVSAAGDLVRELGPAGQDVAFRGDSTRELLAHTADGVVSFDRKKPAVLQTLAKTAFESHLLAAPDGGKAVGVFGTGDTARIRVFQLDGEGVARQLGGPGVPVAWSWDSEWILIQEGVVAGEAGGNGEDGESRLDRPDLLEPFDPFVLAAPKKKKKPDPPPKPKGPTTRACAARASGGEVKCWDDYIGLGFSPDSTLVLLRKGTTLYAGKIAGVRPEPPGKLIENVDGAAAWLNQ